MQDSHQALLQFSHFLSRCIWEYGDYLFAGLVFASVILIARILSRQSKHRPPPVTIIIIPHQGRGE